MLVDGQTVQGIVGSSQAPIVVRIVPLPAERAPKGAPLSAGLGRVLDPETPPITLLAGLSGG